MPSAEGLAETRARRRVIQLPPHLANQIAAGEVVARPASVVKELCENSIDAAARRIHVDIEGGGVERILVVDDGWGMDADDALLSLSRHATSKIVALEDLAAIATLGFRGEALPSIASVSRLCLRTRTREAAEGVELRACGEQAPTLAPCGCAPGTSAEVADLFFNVPARRKFLRATSTESAHVGEVVRELALSHPRVGFELRRDGRLAQRWLPATDRADRAAEAFEGQLVVCAGERGAVRVEALLAPAERARLGAGGLSIFVAGRAVRDRALARAVASAYGPALEPGRYPAGVVYIDLPLDLVDVNVHPQKAEVRFAQARAVTDAVFSIIQADLVQALGLPASSRAPQFPRRTDGEAPGGWTFADAGEPYAAPPASFYEPTVSPLPEAEGRWRHLATLRDRFLLYELPHGIAVVDGRRALAESLADRLRAELADGRVVAQRLLFPVSVPCDEATCLAAEAAAEALASLGFELAQIGPSRIAAHALPRLLVDGAAESLLEVVLERLRRAAAPPFGVDVPALLAELAACAARTSTTPLPADLDAAGAVVRELRFDELE